MQTERTSSRGRINPERLALIESAARAGADMSDLTSPERLLYWKLRYLHASYRLGGISAENARTARQDFVKDYGLDEQRCEIWNESVRIINSIDTKLSELNKSGCEQCRRIARIFTGLIKPD